MTTKELFSIIASGFVKKVLCLDTCVLNLNFKNMKPKLLKSVIFVALAVLFSSYSMAQRINFDKLIKAGELTLFQEVQNPTAYYYISDKPHLATDENGKPKFSFIRYVKNSESGEVDGGGIVHAVIELGVTKEQLSEATNELRRKAPGASIKGPVMYQEGTIALISSVANEESEFSKQVIGIGKAPLLDGQKAAVSVQLTKDGSKILWESFQTSTPDMSISFEMKLTGYRSPKRALIEADFEQVYEHKKIQAAMAAPVLAAEIKASFDDLVKKGAIKLTQVGEDQQMEKLVETAYNKLLKMMFDPVGGTGTPSLGSLTSMGPDRNSRSLLDRASTMLNTARREARTENQRREQQERRAAAQAASTRSRPSTTPRERMPIPPPSVAPTIPTTPSTPREGDAPETPPDPDVAPTGDIDADLRRDMDRLGLNPAGEDTANTRPTTPTTSPGLANPNGSAARNNATVPRFTPPRRVSNERAGQIERRQAQDNPQQRQRGQRETVPSFAIAASFELKKIRQKGKFTIDLNKYTSDEITMRFDGNFGTIKCKDCFRKFNLDDPMYKQREITAYVDGANLDDFGKYINFANLTFRKKHENGESTIDELKIDRNNFAETGNNFKLMYGWKGDDNRDKWLDYEYKTTWSFFGGSTIPGEWQSSDVGAISLAPPYIRNVIDLEADPGTMEEQNIRMVIVKLYYKVGDTEQMEEVKFYTSKEEYSKQAYIYLPKSDTSYEFEVLWYVKGAGQKTSGRQQGNSSVLFLDDFVTI